MSKKTPRELKEEMNKKIERIIYARGGIIHSSIEIENYINGILIHYFIYQGKESEFLTKFLMDSFCSAGLKMNVLEKIGVLSSEYKGISDDIRRLNNIRNLVAHATPYLIFENDVSRPLLFSSKKLEPIDINEKIKEFNNLYPKVADGLFSVLKKLQEKKDK